MISVVINTRDRQQMLFALLKSIYGLILPSDIEIIVVDDDSEEDFSSRLKEKFPKVKLIRNKKRIYLIASRNKGWKVSKGEIVFFIDDDNEIKDKDFFNKAISVFSKNDGIGFLGCRTYYFDDPNRILIGPNRFNKMTGKTSFLIMNQIEKGQMNGLLKTHDNPNAFFTKKEYLERVGGFSEEIVQTFSEADYAEKIRKIGLSVFQDAELKVYHKSPVVNFKKISSRMMGNSPDRFYFLMRNRFVFIKKYGSLLDKILFTFLFSNIYSFYYLFYTIINKEYKMTLSGIRGIRDGLVFMLTGKLKNYYS